MFMAVMIVRRSRAAGCCVTMSEKHCLLDFKAQAVDDAVGCEDLAGLVGVEGCQRLQRELQFLLDAAAHEQDVIAQFAQLAVKMGPYGVIGSPLVTRFLL